MFRNILVPLDGSAAAESAVAPAAALAQAHGAQLHLVLVTELTRTDATFDDLLDTEHQSYRDDRMEEMAKRLYVDLGIAVRVSRLVGMGAVAVALADYADDSAVDLIVMTTHGRTGVRRAWLGSVADEVMHLVTTPLLLLRREEKGAAPASRSLDRILVTLDGSESAEAALAAARALSYQQNGTLILARVVSPVPLELAQAPGVVLPDAEATQVAVDEATRYLDALAAKRQTESGENVETVVELEPIGFPMPPTAATIADLAHRKRADLVALTTHERGFSRMLLGSVADRILRDTNCALLICHGTGTHVPLTVGEKDQVAAVAS